MPRSIRTEQCDKTYHHHAPMAKFPRPISLPPIKKRKSSPDRSKVVSQVQGLSPLHKSITIPFPLPIYDMANGLMPAVILPRTGQGFI